MVNTFLATLAKYLPFSSSDQSDATLSVEAINFSTFCPNAKMVAGVILSFSPISIYPSAKPKIKARSIFNRWHNFGSESNICTASLTISIFFSSELIVMVRRYSSDTGASSSSTVCNFRISDLTSSDSSFMIS